MSSNVVTCFVFVAFSNFILIKLNKIYISIVVVICSKKNEIAETSPSSFFNNDIQPVNGSKATRDRVVQIRSYSLWRYVWKITVDIQLEQFKIIVIRKVSS